MARQKRFTIEFDQEALDQLGAFESKHRGTIKRTLLEQLTTEADKETRNRKRLERPGPFEATWELRCGVDNEFRVFYDVDAENLVVRVHAVGLKLREKLFFGGKEFKR